MVDETFSHDEVRDGAGNVISQKIVSSMDTLVVTQDNQWAGRAGVVTLSPTADITIYADTLRIRGPITARGKDVKVIARVLSTEPDSNKHDAAIIVDGKDGATADPLPVPKAPTPPQMPGGYVRCVGKDTPPTNGIAWGVPSARGGDGTAGKKAGSVHVACFKPVGDQHPFQLALSAQGGRGGNGAKGQDGADGGKGGKGDNACTCIIVPNVGAQNGARGGDGTQGGRGGDAGHGGEGGEAAFQCVLLVPSSVSCTANAGPDGTPGKGGGGGQGGPGGDGGAGLTVTAGNPNNPYDYDQYLLPPGNTGPRGADAGAGPDGGVVGTQPKAGNAHADRVSADRLAPASAETRAWLTMELARAEYDFLAAGDDLQSDHLKQAKLRYQWLAELSEGHIKAKTNVESGVHNVFNTATNRLKSIGAGLNCFGQRADFVPMGSVDYWTKQTQEALDDLKTFEPFYRAYVDAGKDQTAALAGLKHTITESNNRITDLQQRLTDLMPKLQPQVDIVNSLDADVASQANAVMATLGNLQTAVGKAFGLSWKDAFSAVGSLAFLQGSSLNKGALIAGKALELGNEGWNDIVADDGTKISKNLMVSKLLSKGQDFATLPEGFQMAAHEISLGDPNGVKLLHEKQDLDSLLDKIASWDESQDTRAALDEYVSKVSARNLAVLGYNSVIRQILQIETDIHAEQRHVQELQGAQGAKDPTLPEAVSYMTFVYRSICAAYAECLYMCIRSAAFWSLNRSLSLATVTGSPVDPRQLDYATAQGWQTHANKLMASAHEALGGGPQPLGKIVYSLDAAKAGSRWADFKAGKCKDLNFSIPPVTKATTAKQSPFAGWGDVRTEKVEVRLKGAAYQKTGTGQDTVHVALTHHGTETLAAASGELASVSHAPRTIGFEYSVDAATGDITFNTKGNNLESDTKDYAPIGPFTNWTLTIDPKLCIGLDLSGLTSVDLVFTGQARQLV